MIKIFFPIFLISIFFICIISNNAPTHRFAISSNDNDVVLLPQENHIIKKLNQNNAAIHSYMSEIRVSTNRLIKLNGYMIYEKDKKFRMIVNSIFGNELDIGSNENLFWFYSRRLDPPYLYYSSYENLNYTGLKTPFNPVWLMEALGLQVINGVIYKKEQYWIHIANQQSTLNEPIKVISVIDPQKPAIIGRHLFDQNNNLIAYSEIESFYKINDIFVPKRIKFIWLEENQTLIIDFKRPHINKTNLPNLWQLPNGKQRFNIGRMLPST